MKEIYSGRLPCFFAGMWSFFDRSMFKARIIRGRVSRGSITSSMNPREAATYGVANFFF